MPLVPARLPAHRLVPLLLALAGCPRGAPPATAPEASAPETPVPPSAPASPADRAVQLAQLLVDERFDEVVATFDEAMAAAVSLDQLAATWRTLTAGAGPAAGVGAPEVVPAPPPYEVVVVPIRFERADVSVQIALDGAGRTAGLFVLPPPSAWAPPPYADPAAFVERDLAVPGERPLPGTLTLPVGAAEVPGVVLVHGSGPNDRDETVASRKAFKDLAWGLATRGIAVLRYDKRTKVYPEDMVALGGALTVEQEVVDDAVAAAAALRAQPEVKDPCVVVFGHSLGATAAPRIGARDPALAGLVLAAGVGRPLEDIVVQQVEHLYALAGSPPDGREQLEAIRRQAAEVKALTPDVPADTPMLLGLHAGYWRDLAAHDALAEARALAQPLLVLQGGRDFQVTVADYARWSEALAGRPGVTSHLYPALDHHFGAGDGPSSPADYARPAPVAEEVVRDVAAWITSVCS